jgi:hypothetical protein
VEDPHTKKTKKSRSPLLIHWFVRPAPTNNEAMQHSDTALSASELDDDRYWAALASAEGAIDESGDADCQAVAALVSASASELRRLLSAHMLASKSALAQQAQARQAMTVAHATAERAAQDQALEGELTARLAVEEKLRRAQEVQGRLADALATEREAGAARLAAVQVLGEWQRSLAALRREVYCEERLAKPHYKRTLLRRCVGQWRSAARKLRHARIDSFWERSVVELRGALAGHYEPKLTSLQAELAKAHADAAAAWRAKAEQQQELKAAFMRQVCQLNLETAQIIGPTDEATAGFARLPA